MSQHLEATADICHERLEHLLAMEEGNTFTMNDAYFIESKAKFLAQLKKAYLGNRVRRIHIKVNK